ncbi:transposase [Rickettsiales endosymbiont of Peranema trichophorum]|uniref:transposase n=1 Tax=Rickettsiales endosymbiont of Peranema trichophorum TaxID=2486577 RepID=UPI0039788241
MSEWLWQSKAFIVMDCAGWHKAKDLSIPSNIEIILLPPYSPELNPYYYPQD